MTDFSATRTSASSSAASTHPLDSQLKALGLTPLTQDSLLLLPLVQVAWRACEPPAGRVFATARRAGQRLEMSDECWRIVESWLMRRPEDHVFKAGYALLRQLTMLTPSHGIDDTLLVECLLYAEAVAELDRDPETDLPTTSPQSAVNALGVDIGRPWSDVAAGLETNAPTRGGNPLPERVIA